MKTSSLVLDGKRRARLQWGLVWVVRQLMRRHAQQTSWPTLMLANAPSTGSLFR
jgi:hypothetical protein